MSETKIEWTHAPWGRGMVWNFVRGCHAMSTGCANCWAPRQAIRQAGPGGAYEGLLATACSQPRWNGRARFVPEKLADPLRWRDPRTVFCVSMGDPFHHDITDAQIAAAFGVMAACPQHMFLLLTKRAERLQKLMTWLGTQTVGALFTAAADEGTEVGALNGITWPLPNVGIGVSIENQATADERIPLLLDTPASVRWVSAEPLLERIWFGKACHSEWLTGCDPDCSLHDSTTTMPIACIESRRGNKMDPRCHTSLDWVVVGGESGPNARRCDMGWIRHVVQQCDRSGTPVFVKQLGAHPIIDGPSDAINMKGKDGALWPGGRFMKSRKGSDPDEWPSDLRVRQFPEVTT